MGNKSDWDLDLRFGQEGEVAANALLTAPIETVEVKRDRRWKDTGNLYIETECWSDVPACWYPSGITVSKATHWSFVLEDMLLTMPTTKIKLAMTIYGLPKEMNRPEYSTRGYLITVDNLCRVAFA
jgi:hypothetical protein